MGRVRTSAWGRRTRGVAIMARAARRTAFTLIELLIVIAVILIIAFLPVAFSPDISAGVRAASGADRLQGWLLNAKMRAKRDGLPTGLRLIPFIVKDPAGNSYTFCNQMMYVQQPDDYAVGRCVKVSLPNNSPVQAWV